jgi:uncharacterized protein YegP (UPF0339 family)
MRTLDEQGRLRIVEMLWVMAFVDGAVSEFEDNMMWRVADLLAVSSPDRIALRQRVADARMHPTYFIVYRDHAGRWRWRLVSANGRVIAVGSESYETKEASLGPFGSVSIICLHACVERDQGRGRSGIGIGSCQGQEKADGKSDVCGRS